MGNSEPNRKASEHVFEIRYRPNAQILDRRGQWAEELSHKLQLPTWRISPNQFDVVNEDSQHRAFVSFSNSGYIIPNAPTANYFPDHAVKFFRVLSQLRDFPKPLWVARIGVRQRFLTPFAGKFEELVKRYSENYLQLTSSAAKVIGAKLIDIGGPLNFADQFGNFNTNCGPMARDQAKQFLEAVEPKDGFPDVGLYFDIDYWLRSEKELSDSDVLKTIKDFSTEGWNRHARIRDLIVGT